jgi:hypothetical protein
LWTITIKEYESIPKDYKSIWERSVIEYRGDIPKEWEGKRNMLVMDELGRTVLITEGVHFKVIGG